MLTIRSGHIGTVFIYKREVPTVPKVPEGYPQGRREIGFWIQKIPCRVATGGKVVTSLSRALPHARTLQEEPIAYATDSPPDYLPKAYGAYHQLYRVDGKLVAMAVLDILPNCVSSVYFMYDVLWDHYSLGKVGPTWYFEARRPGS